jgi:thioredoxin reductase
MPAENAYDVVIAGGGPAGLSAALMLGRCRRRVIVCDAGAPRNAASGGLHGYLSRDGVLPGELLRIGREEIARYGVEFRRAVVAEARREEGGFAAVLDDGTTLRCRKLLLATGVRDNPPEIEGVERFYGRSVFHCPYCDGWEMRDQPLAAHGRGAPGAGLAISLRTWSPDVVLCTDGPPRLSRSDRARLDERGIPVIAKRIARLEGRDAALDCIVFADGDMLHRRAVFFTARQDQQCGLAASFGCEFTSKGTVRTDHHQATNIPGLYCAGDASFDVQFVIVAAAEGAKAAVAINTALQAEDAARRLILAD